MESQQTVLKQGSPVKYQDGDRWLDFPITLKWQTGIWFELFEKHVEFIIEDINRARAEKKFIVYLSCPISNRGGGYSLTNIEIALHTAHRLITNWGNRFWVLNPTLYQMESREGTGLIRRHAKLLSLEKKFSEEIDVARLYQNSPPTGPDYLRMWARVLIEDSDKNLGNRIDAFYFLGPSDTWNFFTHPGARTTTEGVEQYFARKCALDPEFRSYFMDSAGAEAKRDEFFRFYTLKAGTNFSLGSHDEYHIWLTLNKLRRARMGITSQIPGYFDGAQLGFNPEGVEIPRGYAL